MGKAGPVLVVDDDTTVREALAEMCASLGYPTETAENGEVALEQIARRKPRLVLLDLKMPVMDGWALLKRLRASEETAEIPVLVLSAFGYEWEADMMGAQGYISKPADYVAVKEQLAKFAGRAKKPVVRLVK